ncbi:MAG: cobyrinate a,c-diamide synthase [Nitrospiraceae bacterium]
MTYPRLIVGGTHSGVGKTTVTLALLAAFRARGLVVQPFKGGPDFLDPGHHTIASWRVSRNLDTWLLTPEWNRSCFRAAAADADLSVVEGMMGLFDGSLPTSNRGSTAEIASLLNAPVLLVIDGSAMARSAAAMAQGYATFDPTVRVAGVLFNRIRSDRHYELLKLAMESATPLTAVGYLPPDAALSLPERHLGLVTAGECGASELYKALGRAAEQTVDVTRLLALAREAGPLPEDRLNDSQLSRASAVGDTRPRVRIGIAEDEAFCFYYRDNLDLLEAAGAELVRFSPLNDTELPPMDAIYLGGGYPEVQAARLSANDSMRASIRAFAAADGPIYAECGGLMYLTEAIVTRDGQRYPMLGIFPVEAVMGGPSGMRLGYRKVTLTRDCLLGTSGTTMRGHEFHYSWLRSTTRLGYACDLRDARGESVGADGLVWKRVVGLYTHLHFGSHPGLADTIVAAARAAAGRDRVAETGAGTR